MHFLTVFLVCLTCLPITASDTDHTCTVRIPLPTSNYRSSLITLLDLPSFLKDRLSTIEKSYYVTNLTKQDCFNASCKVCGNKVLHILFTMGLRQERLLQHATSILTSGCYNITTKNKAGRTSLDVDLMWALQQPKQPNGSADPTAVTLITLMRNTYPQQRTVLLRTLHILNDDTGPNSNDD